MLPDQIAQELNNYFINVGSTLVSKLPKSNRVYTDILNLPIKNSFYCDSIFISEILSEINHLNKKKSSEPDVFNSTIVSDIAQQIVLPLQFIYNLFLETGYYFPINWKLLKLFLFIKKMILANRVITGQSLFNCCQFSQKYVRKKSYVKDWFNFGIKIMYYTWLSIWFFVKNTGYVSLCSGWSYWKIYKGIEWW